MIWIPLAVLTGLAVAGMVRYLDYLDAIWEARQWWMKRHGEVTFSLSDEYLDSQASAILRWVQGFNRQWLHELNHRRGCIAPKSVSPMSKFDYIRKVPYESGSRSDQ